MESAFSREEDAVGAAIALATIAHNVLLKKRTVHTFSQFPVELTFRPFNQLITPIISKATITAVDTFAAFVSLGSRWRPCLRFFAHTDTHRNNRLSDVCIKSSELDISLHNTRTHGHAKRGMPFASVCYPKGAPDSHPQASGPHPSCPLSQHVNPVIFPSRAISIFFTRVFARVVTRWRHATLANPCSQAPPLHNPIDALPSPPPWACPTRGVRKLASPPKCVSVLLLLL